MKHVQCTLCSTMMRVVYLRERKTWRRVGWGCPRCGKLEPPIYGDFKKK